jgi:hypothetical protein
MLTSLARWATGRSANDQPLTEAARVALEDDPTPRIVRYEVDHEGHPIEIPKVDFRTQISLFKE